MLGCFACAIYAQENVLFCHGSVIKKSSVAKKNGEHCLKDSFCVDRPEVLLE